MLGLVFQLLAGPRSSRTLVYTVVPLEVRLERCMIVCPTVFTHANDLRGSTPAGAPARGLPTRQPL